MAYRDPAPKGTQERAEQEFGREFEAVVNRLVAEQDPPSGSKRISDARKVALWGLQDGRVDPDILRQKLLTTGLGEEAQNMAVVQENPDNEELMMAYALGVGSIQGVKDPAALADQLVEFARWPYRWSTLSDIDDPDEMVTEANRIEREWLKTQGGNIATPDGGTVEQTQSEAPSALVAPATNGYARTATPAPDEGQDWSY